MKKIFFAALMLLVAVGATAQLQVYPNGRVRIGSDWWEDHGMFNPTLMDTTTQLRVLGPEYMGDNAVMSFGGQFFKDSKTVMVGEAYKAGDPNSDLLWLHGANGFCFTQNSTASDTILRFDNYDNEFLFKYPVKSEGVLLTSDERLKENIRHADGALSLLSGLNGVTYNYKPRKSPFADVVAESEQGMKNKEFYDKYYADLEAVRSSQLHYGFIAQELQQVLPDLVHKGKDGMLSVDYIGIIPLLVNAVNELNTRNQELENELNELKAPSISHAPAQQPTGVDDLLADRAEVLGQNDPNPFSSDTRIAYNLPEGTQTAMICIYDLQGKQVEQLAVTEMGAGSVTLHGGNLQAGMYIYCLIADGKELASKKMILTK